MPKLPNTDESGNMTGQVTKKTEKGYGFLRDETGEQRFFHARDCRTPWDLITEGDQVDFEPTEVTPSGKDNGLRAREVLKVVG